MEVASPPLEPLGVPDGQAAGHAGVLTYQSLLGESL